MAESYELFKDAIEAIGARKVARALGLQSVSSAYRLARHPMDEDDPDGTGARNDLDRLEQLMDVLAAHPHARPVLIRFRLFFDGTFRRALDHEEVLPLTSDRVADKAARLCKEFGELLAEMPSMDPDRIVNEGSELMAVLDRLIQAAEATKEEASARRLRAHG